MRLLHLPPIHPFVCPSVLRHRITDMDSSTCIYLRVKPARSRTHYDGSRQFFIKLSCRQSVNDHNLLETGEI